MKSATCASLPAAPRMERSTARPRRLASICAGVGMVATG
jgi:hypothetical protein